MRIRVLPVVVAALMLFGACSSGDEGGSDVATLGESTAATEVSEDKDDADSPKDRQEAAVEFARCMREHGVDMPDPEIDSEGRTRMRVAGKDGVAEDDDFEEANKACRHLLDAAAPDLSDEQRQEMHDAGLAFARCMREQGIDMPDPGANGEMMLSGSRDSLDPKSEEFQKAHEACREHLGSIEGVAGGFGGRR